MSTRRTGGGGAAPLILASTSLALTLVGSLAVLPAVVSPDPSGMDFVLLPYVGAPAFLLSAVALLAARIWRDVPAWHAAAALVAAMACVHPLILPALFIAFWPLTPVLAALAAVGSVASQGMAMRRMMVKSG